MKDPTPETPLTAADLGKIASDGLDEVVDGNRARNADLLKKNAGYLAKAAALASHPDYEKPRWWLGVLSLLAGIGLSLAAALGAPPDDVATAQQIAQGVEQAAGQVIAGAEDGHLEEGIAGAALIALPLVIGLVNRRKAKP
jgi:hypothetical protein